MSEMPNNTQGAEAATESSDNEAPKGKLAGMCQDKSRFAVMLSGLAIVFALVGVIGIFCALNGVSKDVKALGASMDNVQERVVELEKLPLQTRNLIMDGMVDEMIQKSTYMEKLLGEGEQAAKFAQVKVLLGELQKSFQGEPMVKVAIEEAPVEEVVVEEVAEEAPVEE